MQIICDPLEQGADIERILENYIIKKCSCIMVNAHYIC